MNLKHQECVIVQPIDTSAPPDWRSSFPQARGPDDKPSCFTFRLIEYGLQKKLPEIRALETEGPSTSNYGKVQRLHAEALEYIGNLPRFFRFDHPDTSFDRDCPWLIPQRHYLCAVTWTFILYLHKPYIFSSSRSRKEAVKTAVLLLHAESRHFQCLLPRHYKLFTLAFMPFEGAVTVLAVLISFPAEHDWYSRDVISSVTDAFHHLTKMKGRNAMAGTAIEVIKALLQRKEVRQFMSAVDARASLASDNESCHLNQNQPVEVPGLTAEVGLSDSDLYAPESSHSWASATTWAMNYLQQPADLIYSECNPSSWPPVPTSRHSYGSSFDSFMGPGRIEEPSRSPRGEDARPWHELGISDEPTEIIPLNPR